MKKEAKTPSVKKGKLLVSQVKKVLSIIPVSTKVESTYISTRE